MITLKTLLSETTMKTKHGSSIRRYHNNVGKQVGGAVYVHKLYADQVVPKAILQKALGAMTRSNPEFDFQTIMFDPKRKIIRFDEAPDFDTASEPHVGDFITVSLNGSFPPRKGHSDSIWHHKWLWVKDDYTGFDVNKSKEWSRLWLAKLGEPAKGTDMAWQSQLRNYKVIKESQDKFGLGQIGPYDSVEFKWIPSIEYHGAEHSGRFMYSTNQRFRFHFTGDTSNEGMVYWGAGLPTEENQRRVEDFFAKQGITVKQYDAKLDRLTESWWKPEQPPSDKDIIYGGIWSTGRIVAKKNVGGHTPDMGRNRWVYNADVRAVFWWIFPPDEEDKTEVTNWLEHRGYNVRSHQNLDWTKDEPDFTKTYLKDKEKPYGVDERLYKEYFADANQAILSNEPKLYFTERYEDTHLEIVQRLFPEEMEELVAQLERSGYGGEEDGENDLQYMAANTLAKRHGFARIVIEGGTLYFNTENHQELSPRQLKFLKDYCIEHGYELVHSMGMRKRYIDIMENTLQLNEVSQDEAALDFLKEMVRKGPFRGNVYLAGGAVRDMVMGQTPKDLDVVVTNHGKEGGMEFAKWMAHQMGNFKEGSNPVLFPTFGTAKVVLKGTHNGVSLDGFDVEAVFARKEVYTPGSRKPEVFVGSIADDAYRRDFTTNSLMVDLTTGEILDITGRGKDDIKAGIIRTTSKPDEIFGQDALRMFRAIRFATKYDWNIDPETWEGIRKNLDNLSNTSMERVRDELDKILMTKNPTRGIRMLRDVGLLPHISKELQQAVGMTQNVHHKHDVFDHTLDVLKNTKPVLVQRLMALFHDIGKVATRSETPTGVHFYGHEDAGVGIVDKVMRDLKYPIEIIDAVKAGVASHMRLKHGGDDAVKLSDKSLRKFKIDLGQHLEDTLDVIHADNIAHAEASAMPNQIAAVRQRLQNLNIQVQKPNLPINGNDLQAMGVPKGPKIGKILSAITDAWFENPNISKEEAIAIAKGMM